MGIRAGIGEGSGTLASSGAEPQTFGDKSEFLYTLRSGSYESTGDRR